VLGKLRIVFHRSQERFVGLSEMRPRTCLDLGACDIAGLQQAPALASLREHPDFAVLVAARK
jgi:hypothetical protein